MNPTQQSFPSPKQVARILVDHARLWMVPAAVVAVLVVGYAAVRPSTWEASQALIVRNEAANNDEGPGKFAALDEMKTVQETILELSRSRGVLEAALKQVGPPANYKKDAAAWPTARDIDAVRRRVVMTPPAGAEFGKTEVFYLNVRDHDRDRAIAVNRAICDELQACFQDLRDSKAQSMISELAKTVELAKAGLTESTAKVSTIEREVGSDLAELRSLHDSAASDSALRRTVGEIRNELRDVHARRKSNEQLLSLLREAEHDPGRLIATPNRLLESQPALRRLKDGLVDAQLRSATLQSNMSANHPHVIAAREAEEEVGRHLHNELAIALRGVDAELKLDTDRLALLERQLVETTARLERLAGLRAEYSNDVAEAASRRQLVERAEQNLAEARAAHASAKATSLIARIDDPDTGVNPLGPGRSTIALLGIVGGLLLGFGVVFLSVPITPIATPALAPATSTERPATGPACQPAGRLTVKQALKKLAYGSKV